MATTTRPPARQQSRSTPARAAQTEQEPAANTAALAKIDARERHPMVVAIEERMPQIAQMLPEGVDPERYKALVLRTLIANPDLLQAEPTSVLTAISQAAQEGIEPTGAAGGGYLVCFRTDGVVKAQLIRDYRGIMRAIIEAGGATRMDTNAVRPGDEFRVQLGSDPRIDHVPSLDAMDEEPTHYYAVAWLPDGGVKFEVMTKAQIDHVKSKSRAQNGPWSTDYVQMARKTVIKRLANYLPIRAGARRPWADEDAVEYGPITVEPMASPSKSAERRAAIAQRRAPAQLATSETTPPQTTGASEASAQDDPTDATPVADDAVPGAPSASEQQETPAEQPKARQTRSCTHPADRREHKPDIGIVCGKCGEVVAAYEPDASAEPTTDEAPSRPRGTTKAADPDPGPNVLMRRLHAQARSRGLAHDDLRLVAAAEIGIEASDLDGFSMNDLNDLELQRVVERMDSLPATCDDESVSAIVYPTAKERGITEWAEIDLLAVTATGRTVADDITPAEWIAFAIRLASGEYDAPETKES
jgi:recombination protein RecT